MIGIVLVTHGALAEAFKAALEHIVGRQEAVTAICIEPADDMTAKRQDIVAAVKSVQCGSGVVIVTDMFGGTPSNLAIAAMDGGNVEVLAGLNLPMLIKLAQSRALPLADALQQAQEAGRKYIKVASDLLE